VSLFDEPKAPRRGPKPAPLRGGSRNVDAEATPRARAPARFQARMTLAHSRFRSRRFAVELESGARKSTMSLGKHRRYIIICFVSACLSFLLVRIRGANSSSFPLRFFPSRRPSYLRFFVSVPFPRVHEFRKRSAGVVRMSRTIARDRRERPLAKVLPRQREQRELRSKLCSFSFLSLSFFSFFFFFLSTFDESRAYLSPSSRRAVERFRVASGEWRRSSRIFTDVIRGFYRLLSGL